MCGIAGMSTERPDRIAAMLQALRHRGPDGQATCVEQGVSLGHTRLAILDPRPEGNQPMWNADRTIAIVYNGEIFNYRELRNAENLDCKTGTDTEVLLKLYERYGIDFVQKLRGMYALGIYDTRHETWCLARDPGGIKPLYYREQQGELAFASEMRSLLRAFPDKPGINEESLSLYMRLQYVPGPATLCSGIRALEPGTLLIWHKGKARIRPIPHPPAAHTFGNASELQQAVPDLIDRAVQTHLVSDKPVGIFLSGGMDSSILLHHMTQHTTAPINTYTIRFDATASEGAKRFNTDADLAAKTAAHYGTNHHDCILTAKEFRRIYADAARGLDQPNADSVAPAQLLLSRIAKKEVDVVLAGAGGDELFGGYPRYRIARILHALRFVPPALRRSGSVLGYPPDVLTLSPDEALAERLLARPADEVSDVARGGWFTAASTTALFKERYQIAFYLDPIRSFMEFDRTLWLVDESLRLADAMTMQSGLECRVPFVDMDLTQVLRDTPGTWHVGFRGTKTLLKDTYRSILPDHLFTLPKASFYPPLAKWIRRECAPLVEEALEGKHLCEYFDTEKLRALHQAHCSGQYHLHILSSVMQLHYWFQEVYDQQ